MEIVDDELKAIEILGKVVGAGKKQVYLKIKTKSSNDIS